MKKSRAALIQFRRLLAYVMDYKKVILLVVLFMGVYGVCTALRTWLLLPAMQNFMGGRQEQGPGSFWTKINDRVWGEAEAEAEGEGDAGAGEGASADRMTRRNFEEMARLAVWFGFFSLFIGVAVFGREYFMRYLVNRVTTDIRNDMYGNLVDLDLRFFDTRRIGDLISRVTNDIQATQNFLRSTVSDLIQQPLTLAASVATAFIISWKLSLFTFLVMPVVALPLVKFGKMVRRQARKSLIKLADVTDAMQQSFSGIKIVKGFLQESFEKDRFYRANEGYFRKLMRVVRAKATSRAVIEFFWNAGTAVMVLFGAWLVYRSVWGLTLPVLLTFIVLVASMYQPLKTLTKAYNNIQEALAGSTRVFELMDLEPEMQDAPDAVPFEGVKRSVAFKNLTFAYDTEPVLRNITAEIRKGEVAALVGESGAGKTTCLDLLARFYDVPPGSIEIDGTDLRRFSRASLLGKMALVTQDPFLFNGTVEENIRYGKPEASRTEVEEAARAAFIHDFIVGDLDRGYDTVVGERGARLSGGQRQRITIARALIRNPDILILDEATGSLDTETENQVQMALKNLMKGRTTFVIAHRLSTILDADRILVLDKGRLVEMGSHEDLVKRGGLYAKLYVQHLQPGEGPPIPAGGDREG